MALNTKNPAVKRIMQEVKEVQEDDSGTFIAEPLETNIFEWHFVIRGPPETDFEGGLYHGRIILPAEYPFKPPSFMMISPQGRFEPGIKLCLSMSAHHPEAWQPSWSVRTAIVALIAFMPTPGMGALGSLDYTPEERRALAAKSREGPPKYGGPDKQKVMADLHQRMLAMEAEMEAKQKQSAGQQPTNEASSSQASKHTSTTSAPQTPAPTNTAVPQAQAPTPSSTTTTASTGTPTPPAATTSGGPTSTPAPAHAPTATEQQPHIPSSSGNTSVGTATPTNGSAPAPSQPAGDDAMGLSTGAHNPTASCAQSRTGVMPDQAPCATPGASSDTAAAPTAATSASSACAAGVAERGTHACAGTSTAATPSSSSLGGHNAGAGAAAAAAAAGARKVSSEPGATAPAGPSASAPTAAAREHEERRGGAGPDPKASSATATSGASVQERAPTTSSSSPAAAAAGADQGTSPLPPIGIQDIVSNSETLGLTALAFALAVLIVAIVARKVLAAAGYDVPSVISLFSRE